MNRNARLLGSLVLLTALFSASSTPAQRGGRAGPPAKVGSGPPGRAGQSVQAPGRSNPGVGQRPQVNRHYQAADLVAGVKEHLASEPLKSLASLHAHHPAGLLSERDERILVGRAVRSLAAQAKSDPTLDDVLADLAAVYHARDCVSAIDVRLERPLLALEADVRDRALAVGLKRLAALVKDGKHREARADAERLFDHLANSTDLRSRDRPVDRAGLFKALDALAYEGFGYMFDEADGRFVITFTHTDGPAYEAGLRPGDVILKVNGRPLEQMIASEVNELLRAKDESRTLTVARDDEPARDLKMTRGRVLGASVDTLRELGQFVRTVEEQAHAEKTADAFAGKDPAAAIRAVKAELLPETLQPRVRHLRAAIDLTEAVGGPVGRPDVAGLKEKLALFREASGDEALTGRLRQEVAVRAMLDGHFAEARQLLPEGASPEHAARLLRDVKALVAAGGPVSTDAARGAVEHAPSGGPLPPGVRVMRPAGLAGGSRPAVEEPADADRPLKEVREYERKWLADVQRELAALRVTGRQRVEHAFQPLNRLLQQHLARAAAIDAFRRQVALRLGRPLTPLELALARERALRSEDAGGVAGAFQKDTPDPLDLGPDLGRIGLVLPPCQLVPSVAPFACTHAILEFELPRVRTKPADRNKPNPGQRK